MSALGFFPELLESAKRGLRMVSKGTGKSGSGSVQKIPVRATLFSALCLTPYAVGMLQSAVKPVDYSIRGPRIKLILTLILCLRCPLTALITYASNRKPEPE